MIFVRRFFHSIKYLPRRLVEVGEWRNIPIETKIITLKIFLENCCKQLKIAENTTLNGLAHAQSIHTRRRAPGRTCPGTHLVGPIKLLTNQCPSTLESTFENDLGKALHEVHKAVRRRLTQVTHALKSQCPTAVTIQYKLTIQGDF